MTKIELLINFIGTFSCFFLGIGLLWVKKKPILLKALSITLNLLGVASIARLSASLEENHRLFFISYMFYMFAMIPLLVFFEQAMQKKLSGLIKIFTIICIPILLFTYDFDAQTVSKTWKLCYLLFMATVISTMSIMSISRVKSTTSSNERSILITFVISSITSLLLFVIDQVSFYLPNISFKFSSLGILIFNFYMASILFANGSFKLKNYLMKQLQFLIYSLVVALLMSYLMAEDIKSHYLNITTLIFASLLVLHIVDCVLGINFKIYNEDLLSRINRIDSSSTKNVLESINSWSEVKKIQLLTTKYLEDKDLITLFDKYKEVKVIHKNIVRKKIKNFENSDIQAIDFILRHTNTEVLVLIPEQRKILVASFSTMMNARYLAHLMKFLAKQIEKHSIIEGDII